MAKINAVSAALEAERHAALEAAVAEELLTEDNTAEILERSEGFSAVRAKLVFLMMNIDAVLNTVTVARATDADLSLGQTETILGAMDNIDSLFGATLDALDQEFEALQPCGCCPECRAQMAEAAEAPTDVAKH